MALYTISNEIYCQIKVRWLTDYDTIIEQQHANGNIPLNCITLLKKTIFFKIKKEMMIFSCTHTVCPESHFLKFFGNVSTVSFYYTNYPDLYKYYSKVFPFTEIQKFSLSPISRKASFKLLFQLIEFLPLSIQPRMYFSRITRLLFILK